MNKTNNEVAKETALTDTMFHKNQKMMKELDYIGYTLLENADAFEIENTRKKFN